MADKIANIRRAMAFEKTAGSRLRSAVRVAERALPEGKAYDLLLAGKPIGEMRLKSTGQVDWSTIDKKYRGLGLGRKMYGEVMRRQPGQRLSSDDLIHPNAARIWKGYRGKKNYRVSRGPAVETRIGSIVSTRKSLDQPPPFTVKLPPQAAHG